MTFYLNSQMLRKISEPSTNHSASTGGVMVLAVVPSVWNACWYLLSVLPVLGQSGKERERVHRL